MQGSIYSYENTPKMQKEKRNAEGKKDREKFEPYFPSQ